MARWRDRIATQHRGAPRVADGCTPPMAGSHFSNCSSCWPFWGFWPRSSSSVSKGSAALRRWQPASRTSQPRPRRCTAYQAQMGGYPGGTGSSTVTDSDLGTAPGFTPGAAPKRSKRRPRRWRALGLWCDVAKPGRNQQRGSLAQGDAGEPGQLHASGSPTMEAAPSRCSTRPARSPLAPRTPRRTAARVSPGAPPQLQRQRRRRQRRPPLHRRQRPPPSHATTTTTTEPPTTTTTCPNDDHNHGASQPGSEASPATIEPPSATASSAPSR